MMMTFVHGIALGSACLVGAIAILGRRRLTPPFYVLDDVHGLLCSLALVLLAVLAITAGGCSSARSAEDEARALLSRYPVIGRQEIRGDSVCVAIGLGDTSGTRIMKTFFSRCWGLGDIQPLAGVLGQYPIVSRQILTGDSACEVVSLVDPSGAEFPIVRHCWASDSLLHRLTK